MVKHDRTTNVKWTSSEASTRLRLNRRHGHQQEAKGALKRANSICKSEGQKSPTNCWGSTMLYPASPLYPVQGALNDIKWPWPLPSTLFMSRFSCLRDPVVHPFVLSCSHAINLNCACFGFTVAAAEDWMKSLQTSLHIKASQSTKHSHFAFHHSSLYFA